MSRPATVASPPTYDRLTIVLLTHLTQCWVQRAEIAANAKTNLLGPDMTTDSCQRRGSVWRDIPANGLPSPTSDCHTVPARQGAERRGRGVGGEGCLGHFLLPSAFRVR